MDNKYKQLPDIGYPYYVLYALPWVLHIFRVVVWGAAIAFVVWGVLARLQHWLITSKMPKTIRPLAVVGSI